MAREDGHFSHAEEPTTASVHTVCIYIYAYIHTYIHINYTYIDLCVMKQICSTAYKVRCIYIHMHMYIYIYVWEQLYILLYGFAHLMF